MIYTSLIFVYIFLPLTVLVSFFDKSAEYKNLVLIISSLIFFTWGRPIIIILLFLTAVMDYVFGLGAASENKLLKNISLALDCLMNTATFVVFSWNFLFRPGGKLVSTIWGGFEGLHFAGKLIPLGIAFYTIRGMSYVFDVYHKRIEKEKNPFCILTYMMSYHFMLVGPIVRYGDIKAQIRKRNLSSKNLSQGLTRFIFGLGKAVLLAGAFGNLMKTGLDFKEITTAGAWLGMLGFVGNVYFLFDGFTDMALGLGLMNGFNYPENVLPLSIKDGVTGIVTGFNKTLIDFFRLNVTETSKAKKNRLVSLLLVLISSVCIGLWYGLKKTTVCGALFFGVIIILEKLFITKLLENKSTVIKAVYTIIVSLAGVSIFCFDRLWEYKKWLLACLGKGTSSFTNGELNKLIATNCILIVLGILIALPVFRKQIKKLGNKISEKSENGYGVVRISQTVFTIIVLCMYTVAAYNLI